MIAFAVRATVIATAFCAGAAVSVYCAFKLAERIPAVIGPILILAAFAVLFVIVATDLDNCCREGRDAG